MTDNKIINSIKNNRQDITVLDVASLTDNEINEINDFVNDLFDFDFYEFLDKYGCNYPNYEFLDKPAVAILVEGNNFVIIDDIILSHMKIDEYVYMVCLDGDSTKRYRIKAKIKDVIDNPHGEIITCVYVKKVNKFEKWMKNEQSHQDS